MDRGVAAGVGEGVDHDVEPVTPSGVHHLEARVNAPPAPASDEDEVGELESHARPPCYVEHLAKSAHVVGLRGGQRITGRDPRICFEVNRCGGIGLCGHLAESLQLFHRGVHAGVVAQAKAQTACSLLEALPQAVQAIRLLVEWHRPASDIGPGVPQGRVPDELRQVQRRFAVLHLFQVFGERFPGVVEGAVPSDRCKVVKPSERLAPQGSGRNSAVASHHRRDALLEHARQELWVIVERQLPIRVRVHVDEPGSDHAARRIDVPGGFRCRVAFPEDRIDSVASQQDVTSKGGTTSAIDDEARTQKGRVHVSSWDRRIPLMCAPRTEPRKGDPRARRLRSGVAKGAPRRTVR